MVLESLSPGLADPPSEAGLPSASEGGLSPFVPSPSRFEPSLSPFVPAPTTLQEIIDSAKSGSALTRSAWEIGENIKTNHYRGTKYVPEVEMLKQIVTPVTTAESVSLRTEFERLNIRPRKANSAAQCVPNAIAANLEYLYKKDGSAQGRLSLAYLRWLDARNNGTVARDIVEGVNNKGICSEEEFPISRSGSTPSAEIQDKARANKKVVVHGGAHYELTRTLPSPHAAFEFPMDTWGPRMSFEIANQILMHEIKNGRPVLVATQFPKEYEGDLTKNHDKCPVSHIVLVVGYKTKDGTLNNTTYEFLNSRGETWGYQGYGVWGAREMCGGLQFSLSLE